MFREPHELAIGVFELEPGWSRMRGDDAIIPSTTSRAELALTNGTRIALLVGPANSGKTYQSFALAARFEKKKVPVLFLRSRDLSSPSAAADVVGEYERKQIACIFVVEDGHQRTDQVGEFVARLSSLTVCSILVTTRSLGVEGSGLADLAAEVDSRAIIRARPRSVGMELLRRAVRREGLEASDREISNALRQFPRANLRLIDLWASSWQPEMGPIDNVDLDWLLESQGRLLARMGVDLHDKICGETLLPLCVLQSLDVDVDRRLFDTADLASLADRGLIELANSGYCYLPDPSEAPLILQVAEQVGALAVPGEQPATVESFSREWLVESIREAPNAGWILEALRETDTVTAEDILISDRDLRLSRFVDSALLRPLLPKVLSELRRLANPSRFDTLVRQAIGLDDFVNALTPETLCALARELIAASKSGESLNEAQAFELLVQVGSKLHGNPLALADAFNTSLPLRSVPSPELAGRELHDPHAPGSLGLTELELAFKVARLVPSIDELSFAQGLDSSAMLARYERTMSGLTYLRVLVYLKQARIGIPALEAATPPISSLRARIRSRSGHFLRVAIAALAPEDRRELLLQLTDDDLSRSIARSKLGQWVNVLRSLDEVEPTLMPMMVDRLLDQDFRRLVRGAELADLGRFLSIVGQLSVQDASWVVSELRPSDIARMLRSPGSRSRAYLASKFIGTAARLSQDLGREVIDLVGQVDVSEFIDEDPIASNYLLGWVVSSDLDAAAALFADVETAVWRSWVARVKDQDTALEVEPENDVRSKGSQTFWCVWNLYLLDPELARDVLSDAELREWLVPEPWARGLLEVCGFSLPLSEHEEPLDTVFSPTRITLSLIGDRQTGKAVDQATIDAARDRIEQAPHGVGLRSRLLELLETAASSTSEVEIMNE